jgi:hypothetical protein
MPKSNRQKRLENATESFNHWLYKNYPKERPFIPKELAELRVLARRDNNTIHDYYRYNRSNINTNRGKWR